MLAALLLLGFVPLAFWPDGDEDQVDDEDQDDDPSESSRRDIGDDAPDEDDAPEDAPDDDPQDDDAPQDDGEPEAFWLEPELGDHEMPEFDPDADSLQLDFSNTDLPDTMELTETDAGDADTSLRLGFESGTMTISFTGLGSVPTDNVSLWFGPGDGPDSVTVAEVLEVSDAVDPDDPGIDPVDPDAPDTDTGGEGGPGIDPEDPDDPSLDPVDPDTPDQPEAVDAPGIDPVDPDQPGNTPGTDPVNPDDPDAGEASSLDPVDPDQPDGASGTDPADPDDPDDRPPQDNVGLAPADPDALVVELSADGLTEPAHVSGYDPATQQLQIDIENAGGHVYEVSIRADSWGEDGVILLDGNVAVVVEGAPQIDAGHVRVSYV
ncbi:hypothetical protein [Anianabacter salinae]|uniref:hypothetical protein n=1 Tax=Anianabacter salinae TaxID=2851023 RepID=UPI00225E2B21|nr:hypothetical protein [Anianabacter salinae]MBV0913361.1 hypothetical protein [Anianabacter salinae]